MSIALLNYQNNLNIPMINKKTKMTLKHFQQDKNIFINSKKNKIIKKQITL
jgi:hypothetical protein